MKFGEKGFDATSLRDITSEAQVNLAAVNYHFGSKEHLFQAVLRRRLDGLNEARVRALDEMESAAGGQPRRCRPRADRLETRSGPEHR